MNDHTIETPMAPPETPSASLSAQLRKANWELQAMTRQRDNIIKASLEVEERLSKVESQLKDEEELSEALWAQLRASREMNKALMEVIEEQRQRRQWWRQITRGHLFWLAYSAILFALGYAVFAR